MGRQCGSEMGSSEAMGFGLPSGPVPERSEVLVTLPSASPSAPSGSAVEGACDKEHLHP